jgi:hypothetical protein
MRVDLPVNGGRRTGIAFLQQHRSRHSDKEGHKSHNSEGPRDTDFVNKGLHGDALNAAANTATRKDQAIGKPPPSLEPLRRKSSASLASISQLEDPDER